MMPRTKRNGPCIGSRHRRRAVAAFREELKVDSHVIVRIYVSDGKASPFSWTSPGTESRPARSCLQHRSPPPRSLPGEHPSPYTCRASLHAPFRINASTLMWLLRVFSRQRPDKGRVLSYCDFSGLERQTHNRSPFRGLIASNIIAADLLFEVYE